MNIDLLTGFGGRPIIPVGATDINDVAPEDINWNFGVQPSVEADAKFQSAPTLHQRFPKMAGAWDGKSTINHWDAVLKNYNGDWSKAEKLIHYQVRGTCGGRAGSFASDMIQHILIASGKMAKFHHVSHAAVYYAARKLYGWTGSGNWRDDRDDGVASGSVPEALKKIGVVQREEVLDLNFYGEGSDDLACQLVCGDRPELEPKIIEWGSDNLITESVKVTSAQELADGIAAGGVGIGSDSQGFSMKRDGQGFCAPQGTWHHYHIRCSVGVWNGRKGFGYNQSWGKGIPSGTSLPGHPGNCFGVDYNVMDRIIKNGQWSVVFGFPLWELETSPAVIPWIF